MQNSACPDFFRNASKDVLDRIIRRAVDLGGDCWGFPGTKTGSKKLRYPTVSVNGKTRTISRLFLGWKLGAELPPDQQACHTCDNPNCINPDHLFAGTLIENRLDMYKKGRSKLIALSEESVVAIRALLKEGATAEELADMFKVTTVTIYNVKSGKCWRHVA